MAGWEFYYTYIGTDYDMSVIRTRNVTGTPLVSATRIAEGENGANEPVSGIYRFTVGTGNTATVSAPNDRDALSPCLFTGSRSIVCDGVTENINLIGGLAVILAADTSEGDVFEIAIGAVWLTSFAKWQPVMSLGAWLRGVDDPEGLLFKAVNNTGYTQIQSKIYGFPGIRVVNSVSDQRPIKAYSQKNPGYLLAAVGRYGTEETTFTFADVSGGYCKMYVGELLNSFLVKNLTTEEEIGSDDGLLACDGITVWEIIGYPNPSWIKGIRFVLSTSLAGTDTADAYCSDSLTLMKVATGESGGEFVSLRTGCYLNVDGYGEGVVPDDATVYFRLKRDIPEDTEFDMNPREFCVQIQSIQV